MVDILLEVVEGFLQDGESYTELSVERLINGAGISRSTFYVYFKDKGELLLALAEDVVQQLIGAAEVWWNLPPDAAEKDLEEALGGIMEVYVRHHLIWGALVDASGYDTNVRTSFRAVVEAAAAGISKHIRAGQKGGYVRTGIDPERTAAWLTWMTERGLFQQVPGASKAELAKLLKSQTDIVWYALYDGTPSRAG